MGAKHITFHSGYRPKPYIKYYKEWLENSIETFRKVIDMTEKEGMVVTVENAFEKTPELLIKLVEAINSLNFKLCFDCGHYNAFAKMPPLDMLAMLPPGRIGEVHLSDNDGSDDQHLALGEGNIDLDSLFTKIEELKINPVFTLEPKDITGAEHDLAYLKSKGLIG